MLLTETTNGACGEVLSCGQPEDISGGVAMGGASSGYQYRTTLEITSASPVQRLVLAAKGATVNDGYYLSILPL